MCCTALASNLRLPVIRAGFAPLMEGEVMKEDWVQFLQAKTEQVRSVGENG